MKNVRNIRIVDYSTLWNEDKLDEVNYVYATCSCLPCTMGIQIPRGKGGYIRFVCPNCNTELGIVCRGINEQNYLSIEGDTY